MIKVINTQSLYTSLYEAVDFCADNKGEIYIIVPDKLSLFMEKFLFEKLDICSSFDIKVSTLNRFAKKCFTVDKTNQISKNGSIILIHKILNEHSYEFRVLKSKNYTYTYAENIYATLMQLKASKITSEEMLNCQIEDENLKNKIYDLQLISSYYEQSKAGLLDASDMFLMSTMFIGKEYENKTILFVGFDDFTQIEYSIIEQLAKNNVVNIFNYASNGSNKYIYNTEVLSQLRNICYTADINFSVDKLKEIKNPFRNFLFNNIYGIKNDTFNLEKEQIKIYSANSFDEEIEFVARDIRNKILSKENFKNFGVGIFNLEGKENKIKEIFSKYEINYYIDSDFLLNKSIFYKFLISILKFNLEGYPLTHLIDIINSPFFAVEDEIKNQIIQRLISYKSSYRYVKNFDLGDNLKQVAEVLNDFLNLFIIDSNYTIKDVINLLLEADKVLNFDEMLTNLANNYTDVSEQILIKKSKQTVMEALEELQHFYPNCDIKNVFDVIVHLVGNIKINNLPLTLDAVKVVDANESMEIFDNLYIVNANAENAPSLKYDCGIILDNEIEKLNFKHKISPTIAHLNRLKRFRVFNAVGLFENSLTLTYSNNISELVSNFKNKFKFNNINLIPYTNFSFDKYVVLSKNDYIEFLSKNKKYLNNNENLLKNDVKISKNNEIFNNLESFNKINDIVKDKIPKELNKNNLKIFDNFSTISASQLESYFVCPFSSFLRNILKIKTRLSDDIMSLDIGNILHEILKDYYEKNKNVGDVFLYCKNKIFEYVTKSERLKLNMSSPILSNLIDEAVRVINGINYIDCNSKFEPFKFEYEFMFNNALKLDNISVIGKIDRIDKYNNSYRIIDYKSGKVDTSLNELYYGNKLQLFLYSVAVENLFKGKSVGCFYLPLHNDYTKDENNYSLKGYFENNVEVVLALDKRLQPQEKSDIVNITTTKNMTARRQINYNLAELKNYSLKLSTNAVDEIKSGYILPSPSKVSSPCEWCEYAHICMRNTTGIKERGISKVNAESFKEGN